MTQDHRADGGEAVASISALLEVAVSLIRRIQDDPLLARVVKVFEAMPPEDRPTIIGVLEREVLGRHLSRGTERPVGQRSRPNPHARLYIRVHETPADSLRFDLEQMRVANVRALRVAQIIRGVPGIHALFKQAIRAAMDEVDDGTRTIAEELLRDVLAAIADARAADGPNAAGREPAAATSDPPNPARKR